MLAKTNPLFTKNFLLICWSITPTPYPNASISYHAINMILHIESDSTYLFMSGSFSHISGHYYLSDHTTNPTSPSDVKPNEPILTECKTLWHVVVSAAEAETLGVFPNGQQIVPIQTSLVELYQFQPKNTLKTNKSTYKGYPTRSIRENYPNNDICTFTGYTTEMHRKITNFSGTKVSTTMQIISLSTTNALVIDACAQVSY